MTQTKQDYFRSYSSMQDQKLIGLSGARFLLTIFVRAGALLHSVTPHKIPPPTGGSRANRQTSNDFTFAGFDITQTHQTRRRISPND
jgi:hypothetical protein